MQRLSTLLEEEDEGRSEKGKEGEEREAEKGDEEGKGDKEGKGKEGKGKGEKKEGGRDSTTSHILSLYGDGLRSWPASPATRSMFELSASGTPRRGSFFRGRGEGEKGKRGSVEGMWGRYTPQL